MTNRLVLIGGLVCGLASCRPEGLFSGPDGGSGSVVGEGDDAAVVNGGGSGGSAGVTNILNGGSGGASGTGGSGGVGTGGRDGTGGGATGGAGLGGNDVGTGGGGGVLGPQILSIDFVGGRTSVGGAGGAALVAAPSMAPTEIAGLRLASNWNSAPGTMGSLTALTLADGTTSTATVTWNSPPFATNPGIWRLNYVDAPGDVRMMSGYLDPTSATLPAIITVDGLPATMAARGYDVFVYVSGDVTAGQIRTYGYAIGTAVATVTETGPSPTLFPGYTLAPPGGPGNYVVFGNLSGATFTLTATPGAGGQPRAPVNGIQIVSPAGGAL